MIVLSLPLKLFLFFAFKKFYRNFCTSEKSKEIGAKNELPLLLT